MEISIESPVKILCMTPPSVIKDASRSMNKDTGSSNSYVKEVEGLHTSIRPGVGMVGYILRVPIRPWE